MIALEHEVHSSRVQKGAARTPLRSALTRAGLAAILSVGVFAAAPASAQEADEVTERYMEIMRAIDAAEINNARQELYLARQQARIERLQAELEAAPGVTAAVPAVLASFYAGLEESIQKDPPFLQGERFERLGDLGELLESEDATVSSQVIRALQVGGVEMDYGYEVASSAGEHPLDPRRRYNACIEDVESEACALTDEMREDLARPGATIERLDGNSRILDGNYVRYGRLSLAYVDTGTDQVLIYVPGQTGADAWREARGSEVSVVRRNVRMAAGDAAPDLITAPVIKQN